MGDLHIGETFEPRKLNAHSAGRCRGWASAVPAVIEGAESEPRQGGLAPIERSRPRPPDSFISVDAYAPPEDWIVS
ncbi:MAG: hypothetical protein ACRDG4_05385, partial [Chloroflexota bacterium]